MSLMRLTPGNMLSLIMIRLAVTNVLAHSAQITSQPNVIICPRVSVNYDDNSRGRSSSHDDRDRSQEPASGCRCEVSMSQGSCLLTRNSVSATFYESFEVWKLQIRDSKTLKSAENTPLSRGMRSECVAKELHPRSIEFFTHPLDAVSMIIFPRNPIINMNDHHWHRQDDLKKIAPKNSW